MSGTKRTILLFTRAPEAEARAKRLPVEAGSRLFEAFLVGWRERAEQANAQLLVAAPPQSRGTLRRLFPGTCVVSQEGPSFGARVENAFSLAFGRGADSVLMVGGDSPPLDRAEVEAAFAHLESQERSLALAPAPDGGVNLIGFSAKAERQLSHIAWLSADVDRQLRDTALGLGLALWVSPSSPDLDRARDLAELYRLSRFESRWRIFRSLLRQALFAATPILCRDHQPPRRVFIESPVTRGPPPALFSAPCSL